MKLLFKTLVAGFAVVAFGIIVAGATAYFITENTIVAENTESGSEQSSFVTKAVFGETAVGERVDLTAAAEKSVHAVVHIKSTQKSRTQTVRRMPDIYDFFFGDGRGREETVRTQPRVGFGVAGVVLAVVGEGQKIVAHGSVVTDGGGGCSLTV
jgi:hypothetical protein